MILAVETATAACSVAVCDGSKTFFRYSKEPRSHSEKIISMVGDVLKEAKVSFSMIERLAVTIGPGSFTGLRVGFSVIQGLAYARDLPVIPLCTLEVLAATYRRTHIEETGKGLVISLLNARMGQCALGGFRWDGNFWSNEIAVCLMEIAAAKRLIRDRKPEIVVGDVDVLYDETNINCVNYAHSFLELCPHAIDVIVLADDPSKKADKIGDIELTYLRENKIWSKSKR
ncbi:MAG: tRNA (adenosine(37)-N6)-threonylcarbamoyltransferase complex dimerization subunit type 1 TsaB [Cellvibrionales bacterium TMED49]|nr:tRNA (adenosine(37)-N6)-threonylcarbamoyltransferase complex dimerization subunit type 1 TsaB [Porticoccaceae bacterium]OUU39100.1 MAG: tRNA (adenosine(37)-N6)-threonylcarbamoyltransferase complex dimerization subunit type 1 TsaB [Cellvibrionales bacterium TMED49]